jgi:hypothetical protein
MIDTICIISILVSAIVGAIIGLGGTLKLVVGNLPGKIFSGIITYFLFGAVLSIPFVQDLMVKLVDRVVGKGGWLGKIFLALRLDLVTIVVALYFLILFLLKIVADLLAVSLEADTPAMQWVNRVGGAVFNIASVFVVVLIVFQLTNWVSGMGEGSFYVEYVQGSFFKLDALYQHNPLNSIIEVVRMTIQGIQGHTAS